MSYIDIVLGILLGVGFVRGLSKGLLLEVTGLIAIIAGIYGAIHFSYATGDYISSQFNWEPSYLNLVAFIITLVLIIFAVNLLGKLLTRFVDMVMLGFLNKLLGAVFGTLKVAVIVGALLVFFEKTNKSLGLISEEQLEKSVLYVPIVELGEVVFSYVWRSKGESGEAKQQAYMATIKRAEY